MHRTTLALALLATTATAQDDLRQTYDSRIVGLWQGDGGTCATEVGTWEFGHPGLRGNATRFDVRGIYGTTDRLVIEVRR
ncbi:hypothetical protein ACOI1H_15240 [Loktanella sp. DJP18]|uniref:hypothetical protein n=1 Tax=Loktanella sp. DJP18 TaxID=3409788 RepID=UPI003BB4A863